MIGGNKILKYRTRAMLLHGMIGACLAGLPLALLLVFQICSNAGLKQQALDYKELEKQGLYLYVWTIKEDISAGEKVTRADLEKKKVWVSETEYPKILSDISQITGKKAKTALKKGTVIQADLLRHKKKTM